MDALKWLWENCPEKLREAITQSPTLIVVLTVAYYCYRQLVEEHKLHLKSKDDEIERLVKEKNALQKEFLKTRLSTAEEPKKK